MKKNLRDIFPLSEDLGVGAIGGGSGGALTTQAIQSFDPVISFRKAPRAKKPKRINKTK